MNGIKKKLDENIVRVIKISKEALFEFIYEKFIDDEEIFFDVDLLEITSHFDINFERGGIYLLCFKIRGCRRKCS